MADIKLFQGQRKLLCDSVRVASAMSDGQDFIELLDLLELISGDDIAIVVQKP